MSITIKIKYDRVRRAKKVFKNVFSMFSRRLKFFGRNSGIHGLKQIFDEHNFLLSRLFWIVVVLVSSWCLYMMLIPVLELSDRVTFTPETRYLPFQTTFPAVTVCETYNAKIAKQKFSTLYPNVMMENMTFEFKKYLAELVYGRGSCSKTVCVPCGGNVSCEVNWREIIDKVHKGCTEMITDCYFNDKEFACCKMFRPVDSEYGNCFAFNSLQSANERDEALFTNNRTTGPGKLKFRVLFDAQISVYSPEELVTNVLDTKYKFDVKTYSENRINYLFSMVEMENDPSLLAEYIEVRGCRKLEEIPDGTFHTYPVYSYGACRLAEDTEHLFEHCGCVHPVRHPSYKKLYCNYTGVNCLSITEAQKQKLGLDSHEHHDECLPSCVESELTPIHIFRRRVLDDGNKGTLVSIQMASLPTLRYIRSLIRTDLDTMVSVGGMVSLFFAASILSIVEIFYLLFRSQKMTS